jgi:hypothetical protein
MPFWSRAICACALCTPLLLVTRANAHGFVGDRFFPATLTTDDPFAVDELSLGFTYFKNPAGDGDPATRQADAGFEFVKEIFPRFAIGVADTYVQFKPDGEHSFSGLDNLSISLKYELWRDEPHEMIFSIGMDTDIGGSGASRIGESTTTFTPTLFFGKGFGDLPESVSYLKPFAVTGTLGQTFPTDASGPNELEWGFAVEYSLPYLQQHVKDIGLPAPFKDMIPLVEFSFATAENRGPRTTTGTINPGILWETPTFQLGAEALIPINQESGSRVGFTVNMQIYIDDLWPKLFGHPVFGER